MREHIARIHERDVDEAWLREWAEDGVAALERYLAKHAAFAAYLTARAALQSGHGDGASPA